MYSLLSCLYDQNDVGMPIGYGHITKLQCFKNTKLSTSKNSTFSTQTFEKLITGMCPFQMNQEKINIYHMSDFGDIFKCTYNASKSTFKSDLYAVEFLNKTDVHDVGDDIKQKFPGCWSKEQQVLIHGGDMNNYRTHENINAEEVAKEIIERVHRLGYEADENNNNNIELTREQINEVIFYILESSPRRLDEIHTFVTTHLRVKINSHTLKSFLDHLESSDYQVTSHASSRCESQHHMYYVNVFNLEFANKYNEHLQQSSTFSTKRRRSRIDASQHEAEEEDGESDDESEQEDEKSDHDESEDESNQQEFSIPIQQEEEEIDPGEKDYTSNIMAILFPENFNSNQQQQQQLESDFQSTSTPKQITTTPIEEEDIDEEEEQNRKELLQQEKKRRLGYLKSKNRPENNIVSNHFDRFVDLCSVWQTEAKLPNLYDRREMKLDIEVLKYNSDNNSQSQSEPLQLVVNRMMENNQQNEEDEEEDMGATQEDFSNEPSQYDAGYNPFADIF
ncbi:hypothetical protein AKO1_006314 [Acrasis kona]|uniref:Uncharacterized protein n=1 Tax=Acrasis kona TaxID=1008807 RepID=A0AAW2YH02_9EUKA